MSASHEERKHGGQTDPEAAAPPWPCVCKELRPTLCLSQDDFSSASPSPVRADVGPLLQLEKSPEGLRERKKPWF